MSTKKVRIVDEVEVVGPVQDEADYWMSCRKPTVFTLNIILIVSSMVAVLSLDKEFMTSVLIGSTNIIENYDLRLTVEDTGTWII